MKQSPNQYDLEIGVHTMLFTRWCSHYDVHTIGVHTMCRFFFTERMKVNHRVYIYVANGFGSTVYMDREFFFCHLATISFYEAIANDLKAMLQKFQK